MSWFKSCIHEWETAEKTSTPQFTFEGSKGYSAYQIHRIMAGVTTVLRVCKKCGAQETYEMLGVDTK